MGQIEIITILYTIRKVQYHFCDFPAKDVQCESNHKETSKKKKIEGHSTK